MSAMSVASPVDRLFEGDDEHADALEGWLHEGWVEQARLPGGCECDWMEGAWTECQLLKVEPIWFTADGLPRTFIAYGGAP